MAEAAATEPIGLVAGWGRFPILFCQKAHAQGRPVVVVGLRGLAKKEDFLPYVKSFHWSRLTALNGPIRHLRRQGVKRFTMAGKVHKTIIYSPMVWLTLLPDLRMLRWWYFRARKDNRDDTLLQGMIDEYAKSGLTCESALETCPELLVKTGILTKRAPTKAEQADVEFGWDVAKEMGRLDVGQSVMVLDRSIVAVEAVEGTDQAILRAGSLCRRGGFTVVKVAKPAQDMRFDVPTVGKLTVETMHKAGGKVLAIEAGKTIILDEPETVALADRLGIAIQAL